VVDVLDLLTDEIVEELNNLGGGWPYGFPFGDFLECLLVQTRAYKRPARVATTGPILRMGIPVVDGVPLSAGDSILVKDQLDPRENGIYVVSAGMWFRRDDADDDGDIIGGMLVPVAEGAANQGLWQQTSPDPITIGTSPINFQKIGPSAIGTGPIKSGRVFPGSFAGNPKKATVVFGSAFATTNYAITLAAEGTGNKQFHPTYENKLTTGFTINLGANNLANLVEVSWHAIVVGS
jgi:hypothetical protein